MRPLAVSMTHPAILILLISSFTLTGSAPSDTACKPGDKLKKGDCWECDCQQGVLKCTTSCHDKDYEDIECTPGEKFFIDCNHCVCGKDFIPECGKLLCLNNTTSQRTRREIEAGSCVPGTTWMENCNRCTCDDDRQPICTRRLCGTGEVFVGKLEAPPPVPTCQPKTTWMEDCNSCFCDSKGRPACTLMACAPPHLQS